MNKYSVPGRNEAIEAARKFEVGQTVQILAEPLALYGTGRSKFGYEGRVVRLGTLSGSDIPTGRVVVETEVVVRYQKTATRRGTRTYRTAPAKRREIEVWPWDITN